MYTPIEGIKVGNQGLSYRMEESGMGLGLVLQGSRLFHIDGCF